MTAVEWLHQFDPDASRQDMRGLLGQMLFSGEEGLKPTEALSGGEAARLIFCRMMLQKPNVLVLDEPTNHLDLESINALNIALQKYEGTVLLVTHDQDLMEEVGTRIWHFDGGKVTDFKGTYEEYRVSRRVKNARCVLGLRACRHAFQGSDHRRRSVSRAHGRTAATVRREDDRESGSALPRLYRPIAFCSDRVRERARMDGYFTQGRRAGVRSHPRRHDTGSS